MYVESFIQELEDHYEKSSEVKLKMYSMGETYTIDMTRDRLTIDEFGNLIILVDDN